MLGDFSCFCCCLLTSFFNLLFQKIVSETLSKCQTVLIQIWVQTVCKGYQQNTKSLLAAKKKLRKDHVTHMHKEISSNKERIPSGGLHLLQKILPVKLVDLFYVSKYHVSLSSQCLWEIVSIHLWYVVLHNKPQGADVISLCLYHLTHNQRQSS